jgi:biotin operon repressor
MNETSEAYHQRLIARTAQDLLEILEQWRNSPEPRSARDLCKALNCSEGVLIRACSHLRHNGHIIISNNRKYRFAQNADEVYEYTRGLRERAQRALETAEAMERTAQSRFAQQRPAWSLDDTDPLKTK